MQNTLPVLHFLLAQENIQKRFDHLEQYILQYIKRNYKSYKEIDVDRFVGSIGAKFPQTMLRFNYIQNLRLCLQSLKDGVVPQEFKENELIQNQEPNNIQNQEPNNIQNQEKK